MIHKVWTVYKWTMLAVVKPALIVWIICNGIPPTIRAVCGGVNAIIKTLDK